MGLQEAVDQLFLTIAGPGRRDDAVARDLGDLVRVDQQLALIAEAVVVPDLVVNDGFDGSAIDHRFTEQIDPRVAADIAIVQRARYGSVRKRGGDFQDGLDVGIIDRVANAGRHLDGVRRRVEGHRCVPAGDGPVVVKFET